MLGQYQNQDLMLPYLWPDYRGSSKQPLRTTKAFPEDMWKEIDPTFRAMYSKRGSVDSPGTIADRYLFGTLEADIRRNDWTPTFCSAVFLP